MPYEEEISIDNCKTAKVEITKKNFITDCLRHYKGWFVICEKISHTERGN